MNIFALFEARVREAVEALVRGGTLPEGLDLARVVVEPPRDASHGDLATNAALVLAKEAKTNPKALGEALAAELRQD
ncbi:arginine--tRNA ligase, partial [Methylobacterium sp. WL122]